MSQSLSMNFAAGDVRFVAGDPHVFTGVAAYRLRIPVDVTATWIQKADPEVILPVVLNGSMETALPTLRWIGAISTQTFDLRNYPTSSFLDVSLSNDQLMALDEHRGDGGLALYVRLQATILGSDAPRYPLGQTEGPITIDPPRWLAMLDQLGSEMSFLLRVPAPITDLQIQESTLAVNDRASLSRASARLRQARSEFASHEWKHCVSTCRQVLEILGRLEEFETAKSLISVPAQSRNQTQRWSAIYQDLVSMASAAHHEDTTTADFVWSRADAETVLVTSAALLARYVSK